MEQNKQALVEAMLLEPERQKLQIPAHIQQQLPRIQITPEVMELQLLKASLGRFCKIEIDTQ